MKQSEAADLEGDYDVPIDGRALGGTYELVTLTPSSKPGPEHVFDNPLYSDGMPLVVTNVLYETVVSGFSLHLHLRYICSAITLFIVDG